MAAGVVGMGIPESFFFDNFDHDFDSEIKLKSLIERSSGLRQSDVCYVVLAIDPSATDVIGFYHMLEEHRGTPRRS